VSGTTTATMARLVRQARDPGLPPHAQETAFTGLVARSQRQAFEAALATLDGDRDEAKDVTQDAFLTAWLRLRQLRNPDAFSAWLGRIVASECRRRLRRRRRESTVAEIPEPGIAEPTAAQSERLVAAAVSGLPHEERRVAVLFYYLGHSQQEIGSLLGLKPGTVGKRLHAARLRIRRGLPPAVRHLLVPKSSSRRFLQQVREGVFDEYVGKYRFERRPDLVVSITREGDQLIGRSGSQRNVLASARAGSMVTSDFDGEVRFLRNRQGYITHLVYYEFGRRLGLARRTAVDSSSESE